MLVQPVQPHIILILIKDSAGLGCGVGSASSIDVTSEWVLAVTVAVVLWCSIRHSQGSMWHRTIGVTLLCTTPDCHSCFTAVIWSTLSCSQVLCPQVLIADLRYGFDQSFPAAVGSPCS